jgi:hypothetical protein
MLEAGGVDGGVVGGGIEDVVDVCQNGAHLTVDGDAF